MIPYHNLDPVALSLGPIKIHWYGLMYLLGFWGCWWLLVRRGRFAHVQWNAQLCSDAVFYVVMGVILGGRIGYTFFYNFSGFVADPLSIVRIWQGGMSFHGGLLGVTVAIILMARRNGLDWLRMHDYVACVVPFGLFFGRLANFVNGELRHRVRARAGCAPRLPDGHDLAHARHGAVHPHDPRRAVLFRARPSEASPCLARSSRFSAAMTPLNARPC